MSNVYQVQYEYLETYCHPDPSEWERRTITICTTLDKEHANQVRDDHNKVSDRTASVVTHELSSRP